MSKLQQSEKAIKSYGVVSHDNIERISVMASDEDITSLKGWRAMQQTLQHPTHGQQIRPSNTPNKPSVKP